MERKGLTTVQLMIILAVLANLIGVAMATHRFFKEKMGRLTCHANMQNIMEAEQLYHAYYNIGEKEIKREKTGKVQLEFLSSKDFLLYIPSCPGRGIYKWDSEGELYCTYHGLGEIH